MRRYVIDPPTLLLLAARECPTGAALVAPNALRSQALELLYQAVRRGELTEAQALRRHERMTAIKIRLLGDRVSRRTAWKLAVEHGWPTLERAEYLAVARLQADALVTADPELIRMAEDLVPVVAPAVLTG